MFTGLVEHVALVKSMGAGVLTILQPEQASDTDSWRIGESIAINGCCLTLVESSELGVLRFELSPETLERTSLGALEPGSLVNLERAMKLGARLGGHLVQGHVDGVAEVTAILPTLNSTIFRFRLPEGGERYLIDKGSIAIDGISLTVVGPKGVEFDVWVIPHTLEHTNLIQRKAGDRVNVEYDLIAKYVERLLAKG